MSPENAPVNALRSCVQFFAKNLARNFQKRLPNIVVASAARFLFTKLENISKIEGSFAEVPVKFERDRESTRHLKGWRPKMI